MIKIYRLEMNEEIKHEEVCHACAAKKKSEGYEVVYNLAMSERMPVSKVINLECELCYGSFFLDGSKKHEILHDLFSLCF